MATDQKKSLEKRHCLEQKTLKKEATVHHRVVSNIWRRPIFFSFCSSSTSSSGSLSCVTNNYRRGRGRYNFRSTIGTIFAFGLHPLYHAILMKNVIAVSHVDVISLVNLVYANGAHHHHRTRDGFFVVVGIIMIIMIVGCGRGGVMLLFMMMIMLCLVFFHVVLCQNFAHP